MDAGPAARLAAEVTAQMNSVLKVVQAHKRYGDVQALAGADVELRQGELLTLLGPNGAGKTTLIRAIAGRVRLDQGQITLLDQALSSRNGRARHRLGVVPQEIALYPLLTPLENLEAFGRLHGLSGPKLRDRVDWALEWTGLVERSRDIVKGFSGGMKRRLNIACGVLHSPDVVLLDEPTVGVDPQSRERIWEMLDRLKSTGASLILTTHQLDEAQSRCDRITIIDHGRTIATGTFAELVERTVGAGRLVSLTLDRIPAAAWNGLEVDEKTRTIRARFDDVAVGLPGLLQRLHDAGCRVQDVEVHGPSLQAVFLHLTGRELRE